jgi:hypothetical protein
LEKLASTLLKLDLIIPLLVVIQTSLLSGIKQCANFKYPFLSNKYVMPLQPFLKAGVYSTPAAVNDNNLFNL